MVARLSRSLQRRYIEIMSDKINPEASPGAAFGRDPSWLDPEMSDIYPAVRAHLSELDGLIAAAIPQTTDMQKAHLEDLRFRIAEALTGRTVAAGPPITL